VFDRLCAEALDAFDRVIGLDLAVVAVDGSIHKAPCGGEGTGKSPADRGKPGWKRSAAVERHGIQRRGTKPPPGTPHRLTLGLR